MSRVPDRFDLWVRQARASSDPARRADLILGGMAALPALHFLNIGTGTSHVMATVAIETDECTLVYTDRDRIEEFIRSEPTLSHAPNGALPIISVPTPSAFKWCAKTERGLLVNPQQDAVAISPGTIASFYAEWSKRGVEAAGFWIPNLTSEEEDFWQAHGL